MEKYTKINGKDLHYLKASDMHPANTYFHFSFADYIDYDNMGFGVLRVVNDDDVIAHSGFGTHPHSNMEIFSYIIDGKLTHRDSAGNHEILERGHVQAISAGAGVTHSELNEQNGSCRFLQIWVETEAEDLPVKYSLRKYADEERKNKLLHIISGSANGEKASIKINQDFNAYVSELNDKAKKITFKLKKGRQAYINCFEGEVHIDGLPDLKERDSLKIYGEEELVFTLASKKAHFIILEMERGD